MADTKSDLQKEIDAEHEARAKRQADMPDLNSLPIDAKITPPAEQTREVNAPMTGEVRDGKVDPAAKNDEDDIKAKAAKTTSK